MSDLASFLQGKHPNPDASQWSWEFQGPLLKDWLAKSLMYGPMALPFRSSAGAARGNDYVMANRVNNRANAMPDDVPPVTGGTIRFRGGNEIPSMNSAQGMAELNPTSIMPAGRDLAPYYPVYRDWPVGANNNPGPQFPPPQVRNTPFGVENTPYNRAQFMQQFRQPRPEESHLTVIPGGKTD